MQIACCRGASSCSLISYVLGELSGRTMFLTYHNPVVLVMARFTIFQDTLTISRYTLIGVT